MPSPSTVARVRTPSRWLPAPSALASATLFYRSATATLLAMATNGSESSLGHAESGLPVARWSVARRHTGQEHQVIISSYHREHSRRVDHVGAAQSRRRGKTLQEAKWRTYVRTRQSITRPRLPYGER